MDIPEYEVELRWSRFKDVEKMKYAVKSTLNIISLKEQKGIFTK